MQQTRKKKILVLSQRSLNSEIENLKNMKSSSNKQKGYFQSNSKTYEEQLASLQKTMKQLEKGLELSRKELHQVN